MLQVDDEVKGAAALIEWFGYWPSFHDAEVLDLQLSRDHPSRLRVRTFEMTDRIGSGGACILSKHVVVTFILEGLTDLHLEGFSVQNVIAGLSLRQTPQGYELTLEACYGIAGTLIAGRIQLEIEPVPPADSPGEHPS